MQKCFSCGSRYKKALPSQGSMIDIPGQIGRRKRRSQVREHASHTNNESFPGYFIESKRFLDRSLEALFSQSLI